MSQLGAVFSYSIPLAHTYTHTHTLWYSLCFEFIPFLRPMSGGATWRQIPHVTGAVTHTRTLGLVKKKCPLNLCAACFCKFSMQPHCSSVRRHPFAAPELGSNWPCIPAAGFLSSSLWVFTCTGHITDIAVVLHASGLQSCPNCSAVVTAFMVAGIVHH